MESQQVEMQINLQKQQIHYQQQGKGQIIRPGSKMQRPTLLSNKQKNRRQQEFFLGNIAHSNPVSSGKVSKTKKFIPAEDPKNLEVEGGYQKILYNCGECCGFCQKYICCCCLSRSLVQINHSYKGIYERFGKYVKTVGSGIHFVNPCTDVIIPIDCKTQNIDLGIQSSLTRDNIMLYVHGVVQYRIDDCRQAHYSINNLEYSIKELSICGLRSVISQFSFQNLLQNKEKFKGLMEEFIDDYIHDWGIYVEQIIILDMNMDLRILDSLSATAKEIRLSQAKILSAQADVLSAKEQEKAAELLSSEAAMQIRFLSTLEKIAGKSKVIYFSD